MSRPRLFKFHDARATEEIVESFTPLIKKYAFCLNNDDAKQELTLFLIETIQALPGRMLSAPAQSAYANILSYIKKSMRHEYILLSKRDVRRQDHETEYDDEFEYEDQRDTPDQVLSYDSLREEVSKLTEQQQKVIWFKYQGYSDVEIGEKLGITRQAVNRLRNRAADIITERLADSQH